MSLTRLVLTACLPVALVATGGCLATQSDIEKLQLSVKTMQDSLHAQQVRSDSATRDLTRALIRDATQQLGQQFSRQFATMSDSVRNVSAGLQRLQGDVTLAMHDLRSQLVSVQEGIGVSQKRINELRTTVEATQAAPIVPAPAPGAAGTSPQASTAGSAPPAAVLFSLARKQLESGATGSAREGFQTLVTKYPNHELAGESQMWIADSYAQEGNRPAADSVYALVVTKYPGAEPAARSLYKRAGFAVEAGDTERAKALYQEIVDKYPKSDEHDNAVDKLRSLKQP